MDYTVAAVSTLIAIYALHKLLKKDPYADIPGPYAFPIVGSIQTFKQSLAGKSHEQWMVFASQFKRIFKIERLGVTNVIITDADETKRILTDTDSFVRRSAIFAFKGLMLDHALFVFGTGDQWKRHRKLIQPAFGPTHLRHAAQTTVEIMEKLDRIWESKFVKEKSFDVDVHALMKSITLDVIGKVAFGYDMESLEKFSKGLQGDWQEYDILSIKTLPRRVVFPEFLWKLFGVAPSSKNIVDARTNVEKMLTGLSNQRLEKIKNGEINQENWKMDVLQRLLISQEQGSLTRNEIFGELLGFILAGHETSSNTLSFAMLELARNPDVAEKLYEELDSVDLSNSENIIELLSSLKYLDKFLKEVQRRHSIVGALGRETTKDVQVCGHHLPKGTRVQLYLRAIHMNPDYYEDPEKFNVDRWDKEIKPNAFAPFGDGPHNCIGQKLAVIETKIALIHVIQKYKFAIIPDFEIDLISVITMTFKTGLMMTVSKR
ncbi:Thromboxane-A synthase [Terramyces sp. JEL0728]|nr:Thromboxane-A synthase [Terramyces sp. JEL0728]